MELNHEALEILIGTEPEERARNAGLRYVNDTESGYTRKRWGKGFTYLTPEGEHIKNGKVRARIEALVIPPAWEDVWICTHENGHIQVTGRDERGRKQYIYHPDWEITRQKNKFHRMIAFGEALPKLRAQVDADLRRRNLSREKVLALVVLLLQDTLIRVGNLEYARSNESYGLTTLTVEHLELNGSEMLFEFHGKSGKEQSVVLRNRRLARMVRRCQELPGQQLFQYVDEDGTCCKTVTSTDVNEYLLEVTGLPLTAKDFRTWGATVLGATELYLQGPGESQTDRNKRIVEAVKNVAELLQNTPAVCRESYIHPQVLQDYENGRLFPVMQAALEEEAPEEHGLGPEEKAVLRLLKEALEEGS